MLLTVPLIAILAATPSLVSAAIFPKGSKVRVIDEKGFKSAMKKNETSVVAFVAPWCGHCQRMAPEYVKAAANLDPLIPAYAVDCDEEKNKRLCSEQGVKGFPTVKVFPRGKQWAPLDFNQERVAGNIWSFATKSVPSNSQRLSKFLDVFPWLMKNRSKPRLVLFTKDKKVPLLWKVLANNFSGKSVAFSSVVDEEGKSVSDLGFDMSGKSKVLLYLPQSTEPLAYDGQMNHGKLTKFLSSVVDGSVEVATLTKPVMKPAEEEHPKDEL